VQKKKTKIHGAVVVEKKKWKGSSLKALSPRVWERLVFPNTGNQSYSS
jgi:hypothetical protein